MGDSPPDDPGVAPPFHDLEVDEDGVATPSGIDTNTETVAALVEAVVEAVRAALASHLITALVAERDEARAVLAAVPADVRRCAEAVAEIEASGVLPKRWTVEVDVNEVLITAPDGYYPGWSYLTPDGLGWRYASTIHPNPVEALRSALAAAGVEAPAAGTDGGA